MGIIVMGAPPLLRTRRSAKGMSSVLLGYSIECLVEALVLIGSGGRLTTARPDSDVDHKDFIVDESGGYRSVYLQVKGSARISKREFTAVVTYRKKRVLSSRRLIYVFCLLDPKAVRLIRMWVVPAPDLSRLATRVARSGGRLQLQFTAGKTGKWKRFEIEPTHLADRLLEIIRDLPPQATPRRTAPRAIA